MANIFELNINLNTTGKSEAEKALNKTLNKNDSGDNEETESLKSSVKALGSNYFVRETYANVVSPIVDFQLNKYGVIYGDQARQNRISNMSDLATTGLSMTSTAVAGYAAGAAILGSGPWGAAIALVLDVAGKAIDAVNNAKIYNEKQLDYVYNSNYTQERLGTLSASKGR